MRKLKLTKDYHVHKAGDVIEVSQPRLEYLVRLKIGTEVKQPRAKKK
ncbi:hypothetical protein ORI89_18755 [Sphingobacterium sp. UT-1RO-CII-1]|nr:hypothetical protein [Sphingobacterium sp. UT-1RO-CII-1]MCY4781698.1 hypothetical protein [Sphingobacterium sp. UT-1RO-CII-1]